MPVAKPPTLKRHIMTMRIPANEKVVSLVVRVENGCFSQSYNKYNTIRLLDFWWWSPVSTSTLIQIYCTEAASYCSALSLQPLLLQAVDRQCWIWCRCLWAVPQNWGLQLLPMTKLGGLLLLGLKAAPRSFNQIAHIHDYSGHSMLSYLRMLLIDEVVEGLTQASFFARPNSRNTVALSFFPISWSTSFGSKLSCNCSSRRSVWSLRPGRLGMS